MAESKQPARQASSRRMPVLAALLAVIAVVAVWLSNCIPGFGLGSSGSGDGERSNDAADKAEAAKSEAAPTEPDKPEPAKPEPEPAKPEPTEPLAPAEPTEPPALGSGKTLIVKIDVAGCAVAGATPVDCSKVCEQAELFEGIDDAVLEVDGASHGSVIQMTDCLKSKGLDKVAIRRESP
jgi:hypothetical protein